MKHIYNTDVITTNAGNMIQTLFCVKTVFLGAGGPSVFYFTKYGPAAYYRNRYNGKLSAVVVETTRHITGGCGCWSWDELEYHGVVRVLYECETVVRSFRIWGADGHRQRESFCESFTQDMSAWTIGRPGVRWMEVCNADLTGTNDYTIVTLVRPSAAEIDQEMRGQLSDGLFENSRYGLVEELDPQTWEVIQPLQW